ncbi:MAG TPA: response regulator [Mycobacteriales bacterium]|nr:response regulator [Mycobacteriales bacterium]
MKILVVDDSKAMRMIVMRTLRQAGYEDHELLQAENGSEGLSMVESESPGLVLSDWNMPEMNGLEFLKTLRQRGSDVPFGFVTSEGTPAMREQASDAGALFLIAKPFTADTFATQLGSVVT